MEREESVMMGRSSTASRFTLTIVVVVVVLVVVVVVTMAVVPQVTQLFLWMDARYAERLLG